MTTFSEVRDEMTSALDGLSWQARDVMDALVLPNWASAAKHGYDRILYGVVMNTMALTDRLSRYQTGRRKNQTSRLKDAFVEMGAQLEAAVVLVQMWRHTLMHTGMPVVLRDASTQVRYYWLLHWGAPYLPRAQHMTLVAHANGHVLNFGALYAVDDLQSLSEGFFAGATGDPVREAAVVAAHDRLTREQKVQCPA